MATSVLRSDSDRVGWAELFFDLVFVFAITQVSHSLLHHYDAGGALRAGLLFLAVWWVWIYSTWALNRLDPDAVPVRAMMFALMILGLFLSMAIPEAFGDRGWVLGLAFAAMQVGRTLFIWAEAGPGTQLRATYTRILIWLSASGVLWIAGGFAAPEARLWIWLAALALEYLGPVVSYVVPGLGRDVTSNWEVRGAHMAERCGLFVIICLGESLLVSGATFAGMDWDAAGMASFVAAVLGTIGMWWVYFHIGHRRGAHQIEHSDDPGRLARLAYTYVHIPIVAGIVLSAVAAERAIAHPGDPATWAEMASALGGLGLFLIGNGVFKRISGATFPLSHIVGLGLTAALALVGPLTTLMVVNLAAVLILAIVAVWEDRSLASQA